MPLQEAFHTSNASERLIRGSNRSGKSTAAAVEFARAVTGRDEKFPKENGIAYIVGKDGREVANVMCRLLIRAGAVKIIRDPDTNEWRAYNPTNEWDFTHSKQARPAPPLIPPRLIRSIAWEDKKSNLPRLIQLHTGWEIHCFSSNAKPPHGTQIDLAWFDEEIIDPDWYPEIAARLVDRNGRFLWSATPQAGTTQLFELHERAEQQLRFPKEQRRVEEFVALLADNQHITEAQKKDFESKLSEEEAMVRVHGQFAMHGLRVYPEFATRSHGVDQFQIPRDWTVYAAIDPGRQVCGVLFGAVPPHGKTSPVIYIFDELYIQQCTADIFGRQMRAKMANMPVPEALIIDHQMSRVAEMGSGRTIESQYSDALRSYGVSCHRTGNEFTWGVAEPIAGIEAVRAYLALSQSGPRLRVVTERCPAFVWEMKRYVYERDRDGKVTDKPKDRGPVHLVSCLRYIIQDDPIWRAPRKKKATPTTLVKFARNLKKGKGQGSSINLGPGESYISTGTSTTRKFWDL